MLSFDIEEFDVPKERGFDLSLEQGIQISILGTNRILDILKANNVVATLFCTANFVMYATDVVGRAIADGHEIACHGVDHWNPKADDPKVSKEIIENTLQIKVSGYRQPRMFDVDKNLLANCGYVYNSSLNPAFIPGKYMHLNTPRTAFIQDRLLQIPASVTPKTRIPMFWLALHNYPFDVYTKFADMIIKKDGYFTTYFHPWEFVDHPKEIQKCMLPIVNHNNGTNMCRKLDKLIKHFKSANHSFNTYSCFAYNYFLNNR